MDALLNSLTLACVFAPLVGAIIAGVAGKWIGRGGAKYVTILLMLVSFVCAAIIFKIVVIDNQQLNSVLYTWGASGSFHFNVGFLIDRLTAVMMITVTFVALLVHIYSIGYMADDDGFQRFFAYMSLFTFAMLLLVTANNFFQLFVGWEGVGLVSYLLIGFWFNKESAAVGSLKAFIVNRVGDFGFILGIAALLDNVGSIDYKDVFANASTLASKQITLFAGHHWSLDTVICILLFIGAMGKSAQIPLHVWLPESMEGPTPISALIHAATMVTAGVFMVARISPLMELSPTALSVVMIVGATGALFLGLLAFVENDIKRVIAFSTMSQLGYMMAADGASAYSAGIFHLMTHACFKALLFLAAGSVIIALHHEQDLRKMGGLKKYLPVTCITFLIGALALAAIPPFAGFYSKDAIIEAVRISTIPGAGYSFVCLLVGGFVTGYYIFRAYFMAFHGKERLSAEVKAHLHETPWSMRLPLILLAIPSLFLGMVMIKPMLYSSPGILGSSITVLPQYNVLAKMSLDFHSAWQTFLHSFITLPFWFAVGGIVLAGFNVLVAPKVPAFLQRHGKWLYNILIYKYGFDAFNQWFFVSGTRVLSRFFYRFADVKLIDQGLVGGSGKTMVQLSRLLRFFQSGYLYHYVLVMIIGLVAFLLWMLY